MISSSCSVDEEEEWGIDKVLSKRVQDGETEYLIGWKDSPPYENSWESMKHLENAKDVIKDYKRASESRQSALKTKPRA